MDRLKDKAAIFTGDTGAATSVIFAQNGNSHDHRQQGRGN
jgi:hypothetical protein